MEERRTRWGRLARRAGRHVSRLPARGFRELREREDWRHHLRRRLPGIHRCARRRVGPPAVMARRRRGAPLMCAGVTTFNALRHSGSLPSDLVAVQGIGGLGHLAVQFAKKFGNPVAAIGRGPDNAALAKTLGADFYIDSAASDVAAELQKLGG